MNILTNIQRVSGLVALLNTRRFSRGSVLSSIHTPVRVYRSFDNNEGQPQTLDDRRIFALPGRKGGARELLRADAGALRVKILCKILVSSSWPIGTLTRLEEYSSLQLHSTDPRRVVTT